ncbi:1-aminocyclopropane-1-carboxylate synthase [Trifolium repens]|nr:1-aminocyclopropane-1-carboxylate synthase [Trifolium repens]
MWIRLSDTEVLMLKEDDVHRVYELPMAGKKIDTDLCSDGAIKRLRKELGLIGDYSPIVKVAELENSLKTIEKPRTWVKGAICYIIHNILCPTNRGNVSLQYADILEDPAGVSSYNWCSHVLHYMKKGLQSPDVLNPLADFHFLMINYMEKMGKRSPFLTGKYNRPSLRDWDVKLANQELQKIHDIMGLENGLTAGVTRLDNGLPAGSPIVLCFDADTCPLSKAEMYLNHCRSCINIYTKTAETLERRITEANAGTSGKDSPIEMEGQNERNKSSNIGIVPETGRLNDDDDVEKRTQAGERLSNDNDEEDDKSIGQINNKDDNDKVEHDKDEDDDEEDHITPNLIDDAVPAACNIIDDSMKVTPNEHDNYEENDEEDDKSIDEEDDDEEDQITPNIIDDSMKVTANEHDNYEENDEDDKQLSTYAWSPDLDQYEIMYCSNNKDHSYSLQRYALWTLQKDEWVSCLVINSCVNCLNWDQQGSMTKLVTPLLNYFDQERMPPVSRNIACWRFLERLNKFKYMEWKAIDPEKLECIMTPAIVGNPGSHYIMKFNS